MIFVSTILTTADKDKAIVIMKRRGNLIYWGVIIDTETQRV